VQAVEGVFAADDVGLYAFGGSIEQNVFKEIIETLVLLESNEEMVSKTFVAESDGDGMMARTPTLVAVTIRGPAGERIARLPLMIAAGRRRERRPGSRQSRDRLDAQAVGRRRTAAQYGIAGPSFPCLPIPSFCPP